MTINAVLQRLVLSSPQVERMARFYSHAFDYRTTQRDGEYRCEGPNRSLWLRHGAANQLLESHFVFPDAASLNGYAQQLTARGVKHSEATLTGGARFLTVMDPDGRGVWFGIDAGRDLLVAEDASDARTARLQHYAVRTPKPQALVDFYANDLGFTVSDLVRDDAGELTAAFLRTDSEHHALAVFRAPEKRFDHLSCETRDWRALRDWADYMGQQSVKLVWGVGRHGPGNDTFFMVHDPDGNLAEISSDLEMCSDDRPVGLWKHRMETLNQWGIALMRS